jgi:hypothetical protein
MSPLSVTEAPLLPGFNRCGIDRLRLHGRMEMSR